MEQEMNLSRNVGFHIEPGSHVEKCGLHNVEVTKVCMADDKSSMFSSVANIQD
jgi:hypothetical protein